MIRLYFGKGTLRASTRLRGAGQPQRKTGGRRLAMDGPSFWKASCMVAAPRGPVRRPRMMPLKRDR